MKKIIIAVVIVTVIIALTYLGAVKNERAIELSVSNRGLLAINESQVRRIFLTNESAMITLERPDPSANWQIADSGLPADNLAVGELIAKLKQLKPIRELGKGAEALDHGFASPAARIRIKDYSGAT
ncbi:MAG: hypothetical protein WC838_02275, partial [Candidatus Margulisiibacteriota bacterium]